jgi:DNA-binding transcriptional MerR regulator
MVASFDDGKDEGALRTIGEVGEALGIKAHVLRYWEGQFPQLQPLKRSGGRRYYRPEDIALIEEIDRLVNREGYTLRGAKAALRTSARSRGGTTESGAAQPTQQFATRASSSQASSPDTVSRLRSIRSRLEAALEA